MSSVPGVRRRALIGAIPVAVATAAVLGTEGCTASPSTTRTWRFFTSHQAAVTRAITDHAYSVGFSKGYVVSAGIAVLGLLITILAIRVTREDLSGINPMAAPTD